MKTGHVITVLLLCANSVNAHHSRSAIYDMKSSISIAGEIDHYQWANPHVYLWVKEERSGDEPVIWKVEGGAPGILKRTGLSKDTLKAGERVKISGNPGRDRSKFLLLMSSLEKVDSQQVVLPGKSTGETIVELAELNRDHAVRAKSLAGNWATLMTLEFAAAYFGAANHPLTEMAKQAIETFVDARDNPYIKCIPPTSPTIMVQPGLKFIEIHDDFILIRTEIDAVDRIVYMNLQSHSGAMESLQGHSIGRWEDDVLVIDTANFSSHRSGNSANEIGFPSSNRKHLTERLELDQDHRFLNYSFVVDDPVYLREPLRGQIQWAYRPDLEYQAISCDQDSAAEFTH